MKMKSFFHPISSSQSKAPEQTRGNATASPRVAALSDIR